MPVPLNLKPCEGLISGEAAFSPIRRSRQLRLFRRSLRRGKKQGKMLRAAFSSNVTLQDRRSTHISQYEGQVSNNLCKPIVDFDFVKPVLGQLRLKGPISSIELT